MNSKDFENMSRCPSTTYQCWGVEGTAEVRAQKDKLHCRQHLLLHVSWDSHQTSAAPPIPTWIRVRLIATQMGASNLKVLRSKTCFFQMLRPKKITSWSGTKNDLFVDRVVHRCGASNLMQHMITLITWGCVYHQDYREIVRGYERWHVPLVVWIEYAISTK